MADQPNSEGIERGLGPALAGADRGRAERPGQQLRACGSQMKKKSSRKLGAANRSCAAPAGSPSYLLTPEQMEEVNALITECQDDLETVLFRLVAQRDGGVTKALSAIPTNWCDPLLTGPDAALSPNGKWGCPDIERLCDGIRKRIRSEANAADQPTRKERTNLK